MENKNYVYILKCGDGTLYTGWTNDLSSRIKTHNEGKGAKYTRARLPVELLYSEEYPTAKEAMSREWHIKKLTRKEKFDLISRRNTLKLITWNVNGLRASLKKGFIETFNEFDADIVCLQETKMERGQAEIPLEGYHEYWNSAEKKGYSGTAIFSKIEPISESYGIGIEEHDKEGRIITLEYNDFYLVNCYTPNSKRELERLDYRMIWEDDLRKYLLNLQETKPVILCGDLNVAHEEIDIKNFKTNHLSAGFTDQEREKMTTLLGTGFVDSFRHLYPEKRDAYTWWSYMGQARANNVGWRIDYFIISKVLETKVEDVVIHDQVMSSDHCPVELKIIL